MQRIGARNGRAAAGRTRRGRVALAALLAGIVAVQTGCAAPRRGPTTAFGDDARRVITYRQLTRQDFAADRPAARLLSHASALGAVLCASIRATPDSRFHTRRVRRRDGTDVWVAVIDRLRFRAEMERDCSWWNPRTPPHEAARILQHEQIHFALFEIAARHLNARTFPLVPVFRFTAPTQAAAERAAVDYVRELESLAVEEIQQRNHQYDHETSYGSLRHRQQQWTEAVERELLETARHAAVSDPPWLPLDGAQPAPEPE